MSENIWDSFDAAVDTAALANEVENSADNPQYREVPEGTYEAKIDKMELVASKNGKPMVSIWFKIISGEYKNSRMFMNQVIEQAFQIHRCNEFLRSLDSGKEIQFVSYRQYGNMLMDIMEAIDGTLEYGVKYYKNKSGYSTYEIEEVFEVE